MTPVPSEPPQRGKIRQTRLFLAAAVLVIGIVVTSVLLLNRSGKGNERPAGPPPISITLSPCSSLPEPWQVDLCTQHQFTDLLQRHKMGNYELVLERAYLDLNQFVLTYHVFSQSSRQEALARLETVITSSQGQTFTPSFAGWKNGGPQVAQFTTTLLPAQTPPLQLHVEVTSLVITSQPAQAPPAPHLTTVPGPVTFDFSLESHGGLVITLHQTVLAKALGVTLERVRIAPSETIIEGTTQGPFPHTLDYTLSLTAPGHAPSSLSTEPEFEGDSPFSAFTFDRWVGQHGTWTFTISYHAGPEGPWVFHFMLP